ncbi:T9SS type A sorting domain-containing protein [Pseudofulvibacter geojedonensis]|uniref:T9SS type A sorting domain-containing protein n=1 Tax=Pseudofulvibacter geojedonensis TaxID=1123758 RepID=A0ABW3HZB4_9FLAO
MKKVLLLIIFCLCSFWCLAQDFNLQGDLRLGTANPSLSPIPWGYGTIKLHFDDNTEVEVPSTRTSVGNPGAGEAGGTQTVIIDYTFSGKKATKIVIESHISNFAGTEFIGASPYTKEYSITNNCLNIVNDTYDVIATHHEINTLKLTPQIQLVQPTNNSFFTCTPLSIDLNLDTTYNPIINWEYSVGSGSWQSLPAAYQNDTSINVNVSDLTGVSAGNTVRFRLHLTSCNNFISNIISYTVVSCSPQLLSFNTTNTQCSYTSDGSFTATFNRALNAGETLLMSLYRIDGGGTEVLINQESTTTLATGNTYTWPLPLPAANYVVKYQTETSGVFSSLETSSQFTINSPSAVSFTATKNNDVYCNGGNDGSINISASGGIGTYQYQIDGGSWVNFANANSHTLSSLSTGSYTIKVRDANLCVEKLGNGSDKEITVVIAQPNEVVSVNLVNIQNATANGYTNGSILVDINGGTALGDGSYTFEWRDSSNNIVNTTTTQNVASGYRIGLTNLGAGTYTLRIFDANYSTATTQNGCTVSSSYTVTEPPVLTVGLTETTPISCNSANTFNNPSNNGVLTATATGGVVHSPLIGGFYSYIYTWEKKDGAGVWQVLSGETTNQLTNVSAGEYAVRVEDANGIVVDSKVNGNGLIISEPTLLQVSLVKTDVFCNNGTDGSIDATITGGTGPYNILWNTGSTTEDLSNLVAGNYSVSITDARGCQAQASITINQPTIPLNISYNFSEPTTDGATDGWIQATITGGTPLSDGSYTFLWQDSSNTNLVAQVSAVVNANNYQLTLNNLGEGTYYLTIQDNNYGIAGNNTNCTVINSSLVINDPDPLSVSINLDNPISCNNSNTQNDPFSNGQLTANPVGGVQLPTGGYNYEWFVHNGSGFVSIGQNTATATSLSAGLYQVVITDNNGIQVFDTISLLQPDLLELNFTKQDIFCKGSVTGSIDITVSGGTPTYTYQWKDASGTQISTSEDVNNLGPGDYTITVTDNRGCKAIQVITITEPANALTIISNSVNNPSANMATDGSINVTVQGGTPPYTYEWQDATSATIGTTEDIAGLGDGTYTLIVKDANFNLTTSNSGCVVSEVFTLTEPAVLTAVININNSISCFGGSNGALQVIGNGGVAPYTYKWFEVNGGTPTSLGITSNVITNLSAGEYLVEVTDSNSITVQETITLSEPAELTVDNIAVTNILCFGNTTGTIDITIVGGSPPYTYFWSNGETTQDISTLIAGEYDVVITDSNNCQVTQNNIVVSQPSNAISITNSTVTPLTGFGTNNGAIDITVNGGTPSYSYQWVDSQGNLISNLQDISGLVAGTYQVTITDNNMCQTTETYVVTEPALLTVDAVQTQFNLCFNDTIATIQANVNGGVMPYQYAWYNMSDSATILGTGQTLSNLSAGTYGVTITDENGIQVSNTIIVTHPTELGITSSQVNVLCFGENTGLIDVTVNGGIPPYTYQWNTTETTEDINGLIAGNYTVTVFDNNNCSTSMSYTITQPSSILAISSSSLTNPTGFGLANGSVNITVVGGTTGYTYTWLDSNGNPLSESSSILSNVPAGTYTAVITDANNCTIQQSFTLNNPPQLSVVINETQIACNGGVGSLEAIGSGGVLNSGDNYNYEWYDNTNTLIGSNAILSGVSAGDYYVIVTDSNNIQVQANVTLTEPSVLNITNITVTNVLCYGESTGAIDIMVSGGTGVYTYQWSNGSVNQDITGLAAGDYTVTISDDNNCSVLQTITVVEPQLYDIVQVTLMRPSTGNSDGSISVEITGGVPNYTYEWYNESGTLLSQTLNSASVTNLITNLPIGTYTVVITDSAGCIHQDSFNLANPGELIANINQVQNISCNGGNDAQLEAITIGGAGGNQFVWYNAITNTPIGTNNPILSNVPAGTYYVVVSNADGLQEQSAVFEVVEPLPIDVNFVSNNVSCYQGNNGSITLNATGGTGVYEYRFRYNSGAYSAWLPFNGTSALMDVLVSGNYEAQVRDSNLCVYNDIINIDITEPNTLEINSTTITHVSGFGLSNGTINIAIEGGTSPYTISWVNEAGVSQASTSNVLSNIPAGNYTVIITDAQLCSISETFTVNEPSSLEVSIAIQNVLLCNGDSNGSLLATVMGGVPFTTGIPYLYSWFEVGNTTSIGSNVLMENIGAGSYYVVIEDQNGNTTQSSIIELTEPDALSIVFDSTYSGCGTDNDWTITTQVSGGTAPYTYSWNTGDNTGDINNVIPGTYLVIVTDSNGCELIQTYTVSPPSNLLSVQSNVTEITCNDVCEGEIELVVSGGVSPYIINWNTGDNLNYLQNLCAGEYSVIVTDQLGCEVQLDFILENAEEVIVDLGDDRTLCSGQSHDLDVTIQDLGATYNWTSDNGFSSNSPTVSLTQQGEYTINITTSSGCVITDTIQIWQSNVGINSQFLITTQAFAEEDIILVNTSNPVSENVQWFIPNEAEIIQEEDNTIVLRFDIPGIYEVTLRSFQGSCYQDYTKPIIVEEARDLPDVGDADEPFIISFNAHPNPSNGNFSVDVNLQETASISVRIYSLISNIPVDDRQVYGSSEYTFNYSLNLASGLYVILLETPKGSEIRKIVIE